MRFSLRETAVIFAVLGLGLASLKIGGVMLTFFTTAVATSTLAAIIAALVGTGPWRAFAIGYAVGTAGYVALHLLEPLSISENQYLSSRIASFARSGFQEVFYQNKDTGETKEIGDPTVSTISPSAIQTSRNSPWAVRRVPSTGDISASVYVMLAFLFGCIGGKFALVILNSQKQTPP